MENLKEKTVALLSRKRVKFEYSHTGAATPKRETIKEAVAKKYNTRPELISIRHIYSSFGTQKSKVIAHIYEDEKLLKVLEPKKGKKEKRIKKKKGKK